ncbi:MAG: hypothetical protein LBH98_03325 [Chitinispirillales bacterium]|jgi:hypothetical protein|nr:hypothetical protein [Chitinispirillales bacterium]
MYKTEIIIVLLVGMFFYVFSEGNKNCQNCQKENFKTILNLSPQQEEEFIRLKKISFSKDSVYFAQLKNLREKLLYESYKENPDIEKVEELSSEIGKVHSALSICLLANIQETKKILTSSQFEKFIEYRKNKTYKDFEQKTLNIK